MDNYRFYLASEKIYAYIWHNFADKILEDNKQGKVSSETLYHILENSLKILHPFMPFVTEEIWSMLGQDKELLMTEKWPSEKTQNKPDA